MDSDNNVSVVNQGVMNELRAQRNNALDMLANANGRIEELTQVLLAAQQQIAKLKADAALQEAAKDG